MVEVDEKGRKYGIELLDECQNCPHCPAECWKYDSSLKAQVLHIRDVTKQEARQYISDLLKEQKEEGKAIYFSDMSEQLGLDLKLVVEVCEGLKEEGLIEVCSTSECKTCK